MSGNLKATQQCQGVLRADAIFGPDMGTCRMLVFPSIKRSYVDNGRAFVVGGRGGRTLQAKPRDQKMGTFLCSLRGGLF